MNRSLLHSSLRFDASIAYSISLGIKHHSQIITHMSLCLSWSTNSHDGPSSAYPLPILSLHKGFKGPITSHSITQITTNQLRFPQNVPNHQHS